MITFRIKPRSEKRLSSWNVQNKTVSVRFLASRRYVLNHEIPSVLNHKTL